MNQEKTLSLNRDEIIEYQRNRDPYLMIDHATEVIPGISAKGFKDLKKDEWFFKCHWEGDPNMPGMLQIEAMVQMSALAIVTLPGNKGKVIYLASVDKVKFKKKVLSETRLYLETEINKWSRGVGKCKGIGKIENQIVCEAEFIITEPITLNKYIK